MANPMVALDVKEIQPGAAIYSAYELFSMVSALYGQLAEIEHREGARPEWKALLDSSLNDLGIIYRWWEDSTLKAPAKSSAIDCSDVLSVQSHMKRRFGALIAGLGVWTPTFKWVNGLYLAEYAWDRLLNDLAAKDPSLKLTLSGLKENSKRRKIRLEIIRNEITLETQKLQANYAKPKSLA